MKYNLVEEEKWHRKLEITIPEDVVTKKFGEVYDTLKKEAKIKELEARLAESNRMNEESELRVQERNRGYPWQDVERYRLLVEERDLYKERFRKLAQWVHNNQQQ